MIEAVAAYFYENDRFSKSKIRFKTERATTG
jgi:hypothetical protein